MTLADFIEQVNDAKLNPFQRKMVEELGKLPLDEDVRMIPARSGNIVLVIAGDHSIIIPESIVLSYLVFREMEQEKKGEEKHESSI